MKALVLSDLHGHQTNFDELIIRTNPDIIILTGDIPTSIDFPVLVYSFIKGRRKEYVRQIYQRFTERLSYRQIRTAKRILVQLEKYNLPVLIIHGNTELSFTRKWLELYCHRFKNFHWIADDAIMIKGKLFIGHGFIGVPSGYDRELTPGEIDIDLDYRKLRFTIHKAKVEYPDHEDIILISHAPPYNTDIDYLPNKKYHAGSINIKRVLEEGHVKKLISGHLHEAFGVHISEKWWAINAGSVIENIACTLEFDTGEVYWYTNIVRKIGLSTLLYSSRNRLKYDRKKKRKN